ncbi:10828_t:CDS:2 [Acaulospora morrowiae]|uniref:10828_t:CDS:1 n=1 Tax=Acaulospora morrowiae TaxID=94023 RepID=A0A9N9ALA5_9GLOM|nr:10828_t:CDS:2 [Acaulospora morrowiae]
MTPIKGQQDTFTVSGPIPSDINSNDKLYMIFTDENLILLSFRQTSAGQKTFPNVQLKAVHLPIFTSNHPNSIIA